jgi:rod shape-determining protein MreD
MKYIIYFFTIIFLLGINIGVFSYLKIFGAVPNLLLIFLVVLFLQSGHEDYFVLALLSGLLLDFYAGTFPGSFAFAFLFLGVLLSICIRYLLMLESDWKSLLSVLTVAVFFVAVFVRLYSLAVVWLHWSPQVLDFQGFWLKTVAELAYSLLLLYPMSYLVKFLKYVNEVLLVKQKR